MFENLPSPSFDSMNLGVEKASAPYDPFLLWVLMAFIITPFIAWYCIHRFLKRRKQK